MCVGVCVCVCVGGCVCVCVCVCVRVCVSLPLHEGLVPEIILKRPNHLVIQTGKAQ